MDGETSERGRNRVGHTEIKYFGEWFEKQKKCQLCGGFSSTPRCYSCISSPAGIALTLTEARIAKLEARVAELETQLN